MTKPSDILLTELEGFFLKADARLVDIIPEIESVMISFESTDYELLSAAFEENNGYNPLTININLNGNIFCDIYLDNANNYYEISEMVFGHILKSIPYSVDDILTKIKLKNFLNK